MPSESTEMYLITVYRLTTRQPETTIREIADQLGVALSSTSEKVRTLTEQGYLAHAWREGVSLTDKGQRIAMQVLRKNRLATTFLVRMMGYRLDEALEDSCHLEHAITDRMAERLSRLLDHPSCDPCGHPIPASDGTIVPSPVAGLLDVPAGCTATVCRLETLEPDRLSYLQTIGLLPGAQITVGEMLPFEGPLMVVVGNQTVALARMLAAEIRVDIEEKP
ncbi:MAG: metal-dependent transcriptional regulator [Chloroflexaceae bacterium]|nr:metal-dependent transcriptional regulator [Chloroflexaceae bacterium]